jgi:hypothetical protein
MSLDELKENIKNIFNDRYVSFEKDFIKDYELEGAKRYNIEEKDNNITYLGIDDKIKYYSTILRSYDSSVGNLYEKIMNDLSVLGGYIPIPQITSYKLSSNEKDKIKNFNTNSKICDFDFTSLDCTNLEEKVITFDLLLKKEVEGKFIYSIFEIKTGGDLDNKKAKSEKRALFEKSVYLYKHLIETHDVDSFEIKAYFATIYNKNLLDGINEDWVQERVREHFENKELLIGKEFFYFVCGNNSDELWECIKLNIRNVNKTISCKIDKIIKDVKKEKEILKNFNSFDLSILPNDIFLNSTKIKFKNGKKIEESNCYILHDNENKIFSIYIDKKDFNEICDLSLIIEKNIIFENTIGLKETMSSFSVKFNKEAYLSTFCGNKTEKKNLERILIDETPLMNKFESLTDNQQDKLKKYHMDILKEKIISFNNCSLNSHIRKFIDYSKKIVFKNEETAFVKLVKKGRIRI